MNILIPDIWLRDFLKTKASPPELKEYLSLCGPSVERIHGEGKSVVYDIEITGNRPDMMSVMGVAREAATILPRFGIPATLIGDPYAEKTSLPKPDKILPLTLRTDPMLNPRWMSVVFDGVSVTPSPSWLRTYLELAGMRSLNNVVDITNFLMRSYGQPAHVFDYDQITGHSMTLRASRKGETLITLDGKPHTLPGGDIVIEDGTGKLIDLCGIMGGENSSVTDKTKRVMLFLQTYDPTHIRQTSMALGHRTEAAGLFEKGLDTELVKPVFRKGVAMMTELTHGAVSSDITDLYPKPFKPYTVSVRLNKIHAYVGTITVSEIRSTLESLGFGVSTAKDLVTVRVPSYRRDIRIDVDVIEEIARVYGYHNIPAKLPQGEPPVVLPHPSLVWEEEIKLRLRDWGYTELLTYSMISENLMDAFGFDKEKAYRISNPLSQDWVYMRPHAIASTLPAFIGNMRPDATLMAFELSMSYIYRHNDLPLETPVLNVLWTGERFFEAKGLAESICTLMGIEFTPAVPKGETAEQSRYTQTHLTVGDYLSVGILNPELTRKLGANAPITRLYMNISSMVKDARPGKRYVPIPKYPPVVEDLSFIVPERFAVGPFISALKAAHPLVSEVGLLDVHGNSRTFHITYQDPNRNLRDEEVMPVRKKLIDLAAHKFGVSLKSL